MNEFTFKKIMQFYFYVKIFHCSEITSYDDRYQFQEVHLQTENRV